MIGALPLLLDLAAGWSSSRAVTALLLIPLLVAAVCRDAPARGLGAVAAAFLAHSTLVIGLAAAYAGGRTVASMVYGVHASDPVVLASATIVVVVITWLATAIPATRAARVDPIIALRGE